MKYDDASWHYAGDFPADLSSDAAATHIGMFVAWCLLNGLGSTTHNRALEVLRKRRMTPGQYLLAECDGKITNEDLNLEGNAFAYAYYSHEESSCSSMSFFGDYADAMTTDGVEEEIALSIYHVKDLWATYDRIAPRIDKAYREWVQTSGRIASPAERFQSICFESAMSIKDLGYRYAKSGPHVTRTKNGLSFKIGFFESQGFQQIDLVLEVQSRELKAWRKAKGVPHISSTVMVGRLDFLLEGKRLQGFDANKSDALVLVETTVRTQVEPFFHLFHQPERAVMEAMSLKIPGWAPIPRIEFILCFGTHEQARQTAIKWLQQNIGIYYAYASHFQSYRGGGLVPYSGGGYAKELAHASHVFDFGDLSKEVTPE